MLSKHKTLSTVVSCSLRTENCVNWVFLLNIVSFNMMHWSEWPSFKHPRTKPLVCMDWRMLNVECYKLSCCLFVVCWIPRCKLSCCLSRSAPCCTCTLRTSPDIGSQVPALSVIYDIVPTMILSLWYCSYHYIVIVICSYHDIVSSPEWILVHLHRVQIGVRVASLSLCVEGNGSKVCSKHFLGEKHDWRLKNVVVVYLIARAAVIVPDWEIGNGLWHLEVKKRRCQKSFSRFSVTVSQF